MMQNEAIVISDDEEDNEPILSREHQPRRIPKKAWVDLISDEENDSHQPPRKPLSNPLADRGRQMSNSQVGQQLLQTRSHHVTSQRPMPALRPDQSPFRQSRASNDPAASNYNPVISGDFPAHPPTHRPRALDRTAEEMTHEMMVRQGPVRPGGLRSSASPSSSLSADTARNNSSRSASHASGRTSIPPRPTLRGTSGPSLVLTSSYGTRSTTSKTLDTRDPEDTQPSETRYTSRRATTSAPFPLFMSAMGDPKRRISRARLGTSSSGQQHIDGEDSDNDNAAHALRHSINAVLGPHTQQAEESDFSDEDVIQKTRGSLNGTTNVATAPPGPPSADARSNGKDAVHEAATGQHLTDAFERPAKPRPAPSNVDTLAVPSDGPDSQPAKERLDWKSTPPPREDPRPSTKPRTASAASAAGTRKVRGTGSHGNWSEDDRPGEKNDGVAVGAASSEPAAAQGRAPWDLESLTAMLRRHERAMWSDQGYVLKPALRQAKLDCRQAAQPQLDPRLADPFAGLVGSSFALADKLPADGKNQSRSKLHVRVFNHSYTQHSDGLVYFDNMDYVSPVSALPKYKSIVRLGPNILAKNDRTLKYMPYFTSEEDPQSRQKKELLDELHKRYDDRVETLPAQRKCGELADFWRECVENFLAEMGIGCQEVLYVLLQDSARGALDEWSSPPSLDLCPSCKTSCPREDWDDLLRHVESEAFPRPADRQLALAGLACQVVLDVAHFSVWHIALTDPSTKQRLRDGKHGAVDGTTPSTLCLICYLHDCPTHGAYLERAPGSTGPSDSSEDSENDGELGHNFRQIVTRTRQETHVPADHDCGIYCLGPDLDAGAVLGLHADGAVKGAVNTAVPEDLPAGFADTDPCSDDCFWPVEQRERAWATGPAARGLSSSPEQMARYRMVLPTFGANRRGPCLISAALGTVSCLAVFQQMRSDARAVPHPPPLSPGPAVGDGKRAQAFDHAGENSNTHHLDNRIPFMPCSHPGPCDKDSGCSCYSNRISCEYMCGCAKACGRRYHGCHCGAKNNSVCFKDDRCSCWILNRECDPWLCGTCGVLEVLDPVNRYNEDVQSRHCRNAKLQRDVPRRTLKGKSDVQGWGLFAGEDMKKHEYIGEYKGEVVGEQESNRRGAVYHHRGLEYLFNLNKGQEIDSSRAGNKMRFINNSCKGNIINVEAKKMFCNGVQRIMLFSKKHIEAGEELFFNYGYPKSVTKNFWERDELPGPGHADDTPVRADAAGGRPPTGRRVGRPRKKGVGQRISSKHQSRSGGGWGKSGPDALDPTQDVADDEDEDEDEDDDDDNDDEDAPSPRTEDRDVAQPSSGHRKRKRKRSAGGGGVDQWAIPLDEPERAGGSRAPEIAESDDDDFDDDLASQESSPGDEDGVDDDLDGEEAEDEDEDATSESDVVRRRRISAGDTRFGGKSQRAGWATRRLKAAQAAAVAPPARPKKTRGLRSARGSWLGTGGRPPKRGR